MKRLAPVAIALVLAACGGASDGDDRDSTSTSTSSAPSSVPAADALASAVEAYGGYLEGGEPDKAYVLLSQRCRAKMTSDEWVAATLEYDASLYGYGIDPAEVKQGPATIEVDGDTATVTYELVDPEGQPIFSSNPTVATWVYEDSGWFRDDACDS